MGSKPIEEGDEKVDVNFESHPPIEDDLVGVTNLLKQTLLHFADCTSLSRYLISLKDITQIIALEGPEEDEKEDKDEDTDDEPDDNIYGVISVIDIKANYSKADSEVESRKQLSKFLKDKCPDVRKLLDDEATKSAMIVNERYINLPPQLSLPTLKNLTKHLDHLHYTHLVFVSKILLKSRNIDTKLPSKKLKSGQSSSSSSSSKQQNVEPLIFINPEEEIIFEDCEQHVDIDVSSFCDENASWSASSDIKYVPHRRIMIVDFKNWSTILKKLEKELN